MSKSKKISSKAYMEKLQKKITEDLKEKNFSTVEEAEKYIQDNYTGKEIEFEADDDSPEGRAQDLVYEAWECENIEEAIELAEQALKLDKNSADAYNILAEVKAKTAEEAAEYYVKGIEAGKAALGKDFEKYRGNFWGFHETRPFMRAMAGYANALWDKGEKSKSVEILREMLSLNPDDNQGMRHILITRLLILNRILEAEKLYNDYKDDFSAEWHYSKAYLYFIKRSKNMLADSVLKEAMEYNPYVPLYMLNINDMPAELPEYIGFGDENEAVSYVFNAIELWAENEKALRWFVNFYKKMEVEIDFIIGQRENEKNKEP